MKPTDPSSDAQIVRAVLDGDTEQFGILIDRYQRKVFNLVHRMVGNRADAEDIAQEVFCKLYENLHRYDATLPLENWLMRIAGNHTLNRLSKKTVAVTPLETETPEGGLRLVEIRDDSPSPAVRAEARQVGRLIIEALQKLPGTYRLVFILKYLDEYTAEEIADIVGSERNTVKTWIFRAREGLREALEKSAPGLSSHFSRGLE